MSRVCVWVLLVLAWPTAALAQSNPGLAVAQGTVEKAGRDTLTLKPRSASGQFEKNLTLRLTGTSRLTVLVPQKRGGKVVLTQQEAEAKALQPGQVLAVIYVPGGPGGPVLLSGVALPPPGK